jgi:hypothetical protein
MKPFLSFYENCIVHILNAIVPMMEVVVAPINGATVIPFFNVSIVGPSKNQVDLV